MHWVSTGTRDPKASHMLYVKSLAAPHSVNTTPEKTLLALADDVGPCCRTTAARAEEVLDRFAQAGVDLEAPDQFQREGAAAFVKSWEDLLACIEKKRAALRRARYWRGRSGPRRRW